MNDLAETQAQEAVSREKLMTDIRLVIADSEEMLRLTAGQAGEKLGELRVRAQERLAAAKIKLAEYEAAVVDKTKAVARATDTYVHENPWKSVGIAAGVGLVVGLLIGRR